MTKIKPIHVIINFTECTKTLGINAMTLEEFDFFCFYASKKAGKGYIKTCINVVMNNKTNYHFTMHLSESLRSLKDHVTHRIAHLKELIIQIEKNKKGLKNTQLALETYKHDLHIMQCIEF
jgi:hypothetical protein